MTRNLKVLGVALGAVFALSAMAASSASAIDTFTGPAASFPITATGDNTKFELTNPAVVVECTTSHFSGTGINKSSSLTVNASYTGEINKTPHSSPECNATGGTGTVHMNSCDYDFTGNTTGSDGVGTVDAIFSITCTTAGDEIAITTSLGCTFFIPAQTPTSGGVTYTTNVPINGQVTIHETITGVTYTTNNSLACKLAKIPAEGNNWDSIGTAVASSTSGAISVTTS